MTTKKAKGTIAPRAAKAGRRLRGLLRAGSPPPCPSAVAFATPQINDEEKIMCQILELSKVKLRNGVWCVLILSAAIGEWIVQGEWLSREQAEEDRKKWMGKCLLRLSLAAFLLGLPVQGEAGSLLGKVRVIDGDTFAFGETLIRLWGIDAPEVETEAGKESRGFLIKLLSLRIVSCKDMGQRSHGRVVARCYLPNGEDIARVLVNSGHARDWPRFSGGYYGGTER